MFIQVIAVILILALIAALPVWPYSAKMGWYPSIGFGVVLVLLVLSQIAGKGTTTFK